MSRKSLLPVDAILPDIVAALERTPNLVIEAPPGAGKTTRVPPALLDVVRGEVLVLEPRRIAARMAARRVAAEMGETVGATVGYQVRFDEVAGPRTRLRFVTEGVLTRRLSADRELRGVGAVVLDEFHERHLEGDLALALLKRLQRQRPDLRIVVMSATLEADPVARFLGSCPTLRSEGRLFDLAITHLPYSPNPLEIQIGDALERLIADGLSGDVLVFLPGVAEIRRAMRTCEEPARRAGLLVLPLHGSLSPEEQDRAVSPAAQRKVILATNVAESSITVDGVTAVIDSGLARIPSWSPWSGFQTLQLSRVSKASAKQRAGRAGRTAPGRVLRTYTVEDYQLRPEHDTPEILRGDLSQLCLFLRAAGVDSSSMDWLDAPSPAAFASAASLLDRLGATDTKAQQLIRFPLSPRLSRMLVETAEQGIAEDGCIAAAMLAAGIDTGANDLLKAMDKPPSPELRPHIAQLRRLLRLPAQRDEKVLHDEDALLRAVLAGFPDRVARRRADNQVLLSSGGSAEIVRDSSGHGPGYEFMVALDGEDRKEKPLPLIRLTARIEPEWLIDLFPDRVHEESRLIWNREAERVEASSALLYDALAIQESRNAAPDKEAAAALLAAKAIEAGIDRFVDREALDQFLARLDFIGKESPDLQKIFQKLCEGLVSFTELKTAGKDFLPILEAQSGAQRLRELAPVSLQLANGRQTKVHYERGKPPWIASRLQDFFGMRETPRIGPDRTPVVVHLLAPNHRAVQTTSDLAGFWERLYPQVRRELMRRYPKHAWPEGPECRADLSDP